MRAQVAEMYTTDAVLLPTLSNPVANTQEVREGGWLHASQPFMCMATARRARAVPSSTKLLHADSASIPQPAASGCGKQAWFL